MPLITASVQRAETALHGYGPVDVAAGEGVTGLLTDLRHWSECHGVDFERAVRQSFVYAAGERLVA